jgi:hypothetical protein
VKDNYASVQRQLQGEGGRDQLEWGRSGSSGKVAAASVMKRLAEWYKLQQLEEQPKQQQQQQQQQPELQWQQQQEPRPRKTTVAGAGDRESENESENESEIESENESGDEDKENISRRGGGIDRKVSVHVVSAPPTCKAAVEIVDLSQSPCSGNENQKASNVMCDSTLSAILSQMSL